MMFRSLLIVALSASVASAFAPAPAFARSSALAVAVDTSDIKNGMTLELDDGEPYKVMSFSIMKQARGAAKTTIRFKNLVRGTTIENTYRSGEKFETAQIDKVDHQFTYADEVS
jgi:elongation factor P